MECVEVFFSSRKVYKPVFFCLVFFTFLMMFAQLLNIPFSSKSQRTKRVRDEEVKEGVTGLLWGWHYSFSVCASFQVHSSLSQTVKHCILTSNLLNSTNSFLLKDNLLPTKGCCEPQRMPLVLYLEIKSVFQAVTPPPPGTHPDCDCDSLLCNDWPR